MRGERYVVLDDAVVTNVITTPEHHVVSNGREWLNRIVLENKTVVADAGSAKEGSFRADVADELVTLFFNLSVYVFAQSVHSAR